MSFQISVGGVGSNSINRLYSSRSRHIHHTYRNVACNSHTLVNEALALVNLCRLDAACWAECNIFASLIHVDQLNAH